ncbi:aspartyl protease family protein [Sphingomonas cavernae]|nr:aspartyl protease family protein [Sphingomonas cavernae]
MTAVARAAAATPLAPTAGWIACGDGEDTLLTLPARIHGIAAHAVLDSGATRAVLDAGFAARHGLSGVREHRVTALTGEIPASLTQPLDIQVGGMGLPETPALILDLRPIARATRAPIDLVLGHEFFLRSAIDIDPDRGALRFLDNGSENIKHWLPVVQMSDGHFCTTIALKDGLQTDAIIDLGSLAPLYISPDLAIEYDLFKGIRRGSNASTGVEGVAISQLGRLPKLQLADAVFHDVPFAVPPVWCFAAPVVLGLPLLMRFRCYLDFGRRRMQMIPASGLERPFGRDRSGLSVIHVGEQLRVVHVARDSPAARAGLNVGDGIIAINDETINLSSANRRNLGKQPPGTRYVLSILGKGDRELVLEEYY